MPKASDKSRPRVEGEGHWLRPTRRVLRPAHLMFIDTETEVAGQDKKTEWHRFRLGWTCYYRRRMKGRAVTEAWELHRDPEHFCREITRRALSRQTLWVFASNPSFDLWVLGFYWRLYEWGWRAQFLVDDGLRFILTVTLDKRRIVVVAVQNYYAVSVAALGKMLGLPKLAVDFVKASERRLVTYCHRDVEIIRDSMLAWLDYLDAHDMGTWRYTVAGQALAAYRHRHLKHGIYVHRDPSALSLERDGYFGGRVEAYRLGDLSDGPYVVVDVNSMYAFIMHRFRYPTILRSYAVAPPVEAVIDALRTRCVIARVTLRTDSPLYPLRHEGRLTFPVGEFTTCLCTGSLRLALGRGDVVDIIEAATYTGGRLFKSYVDDLYGQRQEYRKAGNLVWDVVTKRLLNSLYGKLGQTAPYEVRREFVDDPALLRYEMLDFDTDRIVRVTQVMGLRVATYGRVEHRLSAPAIPAHVTDYARLYLAAIMEQVGWERVVYCDTDSLIIRKADLPRLADRIHPTRLGALTVEGEALRVVVHGAKDYRFGVKVKLKGVSRNATVVSPDAYEIRVWPHLRTLMRDSWRELHTETPFWVLDRAEMTETQRLGLYPVSKRIKRLARKYQKGVVAADGSVSPLTFGTSDGQH